MTPPSEQSDYRECAWCNEIVRIRRDGRLAVHRWEVDFDRVHGRPILGRCVGSATTVADAEIAREMCS